jgi:tetratricopeptide (TPR) repeat protein
MRPFVTILLFSLVVVPSLGQERRSGRKPILIREDQTESKVEEEIFTRDPVAAEKNLEVGDFYFKRKNFKAAEARYRRAIKYNTEWPKAYEKLIQVYERQGDFDSAIEVCYEFVDANPSSKKAKDFEKRATRFKDERASQP